MWMRSMRPMREQDFLYCSSSEQVGVIWHDRGISRDLDDILPAQALSALAKPLGDSRVPNTGRPLAFYALDRSLTAHSLHVTWQTCNENTFLKKKTRPGMSNSTTKAVGHLLFKIHDSFCTEIASSWLTCSLYIMFFCSNRCVHRQAAITSFKHGVDFSTDMSSFNCDWKRACKLLLDRAIAMILPRFWAKLGNSWMSHY